MNTIAHDIGYDPLLFTQIEGKGQKVSELKAQSVAEEFESLFLYHLLKEMDKTIDREENDMLFSQSEKTFRQFFNQELAREMAHSGGIGLAPLIIPEIAQHEPQGATQ